MSSTIGTVKHKTFTYRASVQWLEKRSGLLGSGGKPEIRVSSPPEFKGEEGVWSPEDLFVAAVNICTMTTFLAFAQKKELPLERYASTAEGTLAFQDGSYRFTHVVVRPTIVVRDESSVDAAKTIIHDAHEKCLISNSIMGDVTVEPEIQVASAADSVLT